jgi:outer membrane protein assembly factor BamB
MVLLIVSGTLAWPASARQEPAEDPTAAGNNLRTGWDIDEPGLSPGQVATAEFGQVFATPVDGQVYAQPIVAGGTVIAATENNRCMGWTPVAGTPRWQVNLGAPWPAATVNCGDLTPNIGVTATPVYDPDTHAVYVTSKVADGPDVQHPHWYLHALDIGNGKELPGFPTTIGGTPSNNPGVAFNPMTAMQRPGLLLRTVWFTPDSPAIATARDELPPRRRSAHPAWNRL